MKILKAIYFGLSRVLSMHNIRRLLLQMDGVPIDFRKKLESNNTK